jgi:hypothetical protein
MTEKKKTKKNNEPELVEDKELDAASGGAVATTPRYSLTDAWPQKVEIGALKAG